MANRPTKYKICYQNRINLKKKKKLYNFKHKKWLWLSSKKKKTLFGSIFFIQHRKSLRFLYKGFLRLRSLLRLSRSRMKQKQFLSLFDKFKKKSPRFYLFLNKLNTRLDFVLYNANFIQSVYQIRQLIIHRGILVNGTICDTPSRFLSSGDTVEISSKFQYFVYKQLYSGTLVKKPLCPFLEVNYNTLTCMTLSTNQQNKISVPYDVESDLSLLNFISLR